ncbi:sigma-70 family RNA polymerase sigma factor [Bradyrhizobium sp. 31Argb]|uniref:RNA polymerase sigma factor n=1 Tax=unclassified Bradyrhizobium TaxID=2631580 RepID=UPI00102ECA2A|nr:MULTISPECIES: sigma-70 family RNA polymerase sigma factor [unclassified Bradyrhizobium]MDI4234818.1 sigma-70 family RNA polymerase sigma factor [Bradyrhizobium sp. Arg237L]TAI67239.1 RNA polymerase subunit sigma-24 [Bradyrhizobium sp. Leo170]
MSETTWASLRQLLVDRYYDLRDRLTRRLGSAELASEALHEVYLRLNRTDNPGSVSSPAAYLFKAAYNIASDRRRTEYRRGHQVPIDAVLHDIPDQRPGPDGISEAKIELAALTEALLALPPRQRAILIAARFEQIPRAEIAKRYKISRRQVQFELQRALEACKDYIDKNV